MLKRRGDGDVDFDISVGAWRGGGDLEGWNRSEGEVKGSEGREVPDEVLWLNAHFGTWGDEDGPREDSGRARVCDCASPFSGRGSNKNCARHANLLIYHTCKLGHWILPRTRGTGGASA